MLYKYNHKKKGKNIGFTFQKGDLKHKNKYTKTQAEIGQESKPVFLNLIPPS